MQAERNTHFESRFHEYVLAMPAPGSGFHTALLGACNLGVLAGMPDDEIGQFIERNIKANAARAVRASEIRDALEKARSDAGSVSTYRYNGTPKPRFDGASALKNLVASSPLSQEPEADLYDQGAKLECEPEDVAAEVLPRLYRPDDLLFLSNSGEAPGSPGENIRPCAEWVELFRAGLRPPEYMIINPLSGQLSETKTGKPSYRCDGAVSRWPYVLVEFDKEDISTQLHFYARSGMDFACITHSAGKSAHALVKVNAKDAQEWGAIVRKLYGYLTPLGADSANKNPSRLSRLPGGYREGRGWQRIIFLGVNNVI